MPQAYELFQNLCYTRGVATREQLVREALRVLMTQDEAFKAATVEKNKIYSVMKDTTEKTLGFFPGDADFFSELYKLGTGIDLSEFVVTVYQGDRSGTTFAPAYLSRYINKCLAVDKGHTVLITDSEKHWSGLRELVRANKDKRFTLTTSLGLMELALSFYFREDDNCNVVRQTVYQSMVLDEWFDFIYCFPAFGSKIEALASETISRNSESIAVENALERLSGDGTLCVILPARFTFSGGEFAKLREKISSNFGVEAIYSLPEGVFRPNTFVRTILLMLKREAPEKTAIGQLEMTDNILSETDVQYVLRNDFLNHEDWRIEVLTSQEDEDIRRYRNSIHEKVKLKDVAEVFRGKSIIKKDVAPGNVAVLNISNIDSGIIDYKNLDTIDEEERKVKRYELQDGDLALTSRGTTTKAAVFEKQNRIVIASANIIIIRPSERVHGKYLMLFFESPVGKTLLDSYQRGSMIMNLNHADIMEMEIPWISLEQQKHLVQEYEREFQQYTETIQKANNRWQQARNNLFEKLY
jgi:hypothetical protein